MEIRADGRLGRPNDKEINKINESRTTTKNKDQIARQVTTRIKKTKNKAQEDNHQSKNKDPQQNEVYQGSWTGSLLTRGWVRGPAAKEVFASVQG